MSVLDKFLNAMKLNDDDDEYDDAEFLDEEIDDYDERPKKRFFNKADDDDDLEENYSKIDYDSGPVRGKGQQQTAKTQQKTKQVRQQAASGSKVSPMRPRKSGNGMEVCVIRPRSMEDAREITETLLANCTVVLNMEGLDLDIAQRIIDFSSGSCFAISGNLQKISNYIFIITPVNVDVSGDFQEILNGAFETPSLHTHY